MPGTARTHFDEDIGRAQDMLDHAYQLEQQGAPSRLFQDIRVSAIAMAVGAMDAYLCDKYVDCMVSVLQCYARGNWTGKLPAHYSKVRLGAGQVLDVSRSSRPLWGIRMAARELMERDSMLSISRIDDMFNGILPSGQKIWADFIFLLLAFGRKRLTGPRTAHEITALNGKQKENATKAAIAAVKKRIGHIIQIRHDLIHNCARPKVAIASHTHGEAHSRIRDITDFVQTFDDHINAHRRG